MFQSIQQKAETFYKKGQLKKSLLLYRTLIKKYPQKPEAWQSYLKLFSAEDDVTFINIYLDGFSFVKNRGDLLTQYLRHNSLSNHELCNAGI